MDDQYLKIAKHYEKCFQLHGDNHKGMDWPIADDVPKRYELMLQLIKESSTTIDLLDFGCGTAHMLDYLQQRASSNTNIRYAGADISAKFIEIAKKKFPEQEFYHVDLLKGKDYSLPIFDYIVMNGVFTEKRDLTFDEMWFFFRSLLSKVFSHAKKGVAFNVMSKAVDWERDDLFHLSTDLLIEYLTKNLSRNFILRNDYGLYEYTVYLYK